MKRNRFVYMLMVLALCLLAACSTSGKNTENDISPTASDSPTPTTAVVIDPTSPSNPVTELKRINYYIVDPATCELMAAQAYVSADSDVEPEDLMEYFIDSMADYFVIVEYDEITLENGVMNISLTDDIGDIAEENEELETAILDAIAQSMLDNFAECGSVAYSILNEPYNTVNKSFELGYIYMDK